MASADELLQKVKNEIAVTREWKDVHESISKELEKSDRELAADKRSFLVRKVIETVKEREGGPYQQLEARIPQLVQHRFFSSSKLKKAKAKTQLVDQTSALIISQCPQFRTHLKTFINIPLPPHLRKAAWNAFLSNRKAKNDFLVAHEGMKLDNLIKRDKEIVDKCKGYLQASALNELRKMDVALHTMCAILKFWETRTSNQATQSESLLCIPFIYCCRNELGLIARGGLNWQTVFSEVAEMYCAFMEMMPLNMKNLLHDPKNASAMIVLCKEVESLLNAAEPKLTAQLNKIMQISAVSKDENLSSVFHKQLFHLVHPYLQKMFVGVCSLETLCFILDQCFIFLELPKFKFMPYCIATWIILHKRKLMSCHNVESVFDALSKHSINLTVENFQKEIADRFLFNIKQGIQIEIDLEDDEDPTFEGRSLLHSRIERGGTAVKVEQHLFMPNSSIPQVEEVEEVMDEEVVTEENGNNLSANDQQELDKLKEQVAELSKGQNELIRGAEERMRMERELHQNEMDELKRELASLKEKLKEKEIKTNEVPLRLPSTLPSLPENGFNRQPVAITPVVTDSQSVSSITTESIGVKKFNPNYLSSSDVQEINLLILKKFTEAMYLICHGSHEEKEELLEIITAHD